MSGVYGSFLPYFGELFQPVEFYSSDPVEGGGFGPPRENQWHNVIFMHRDTMTLEAQHIDGYDAIDWENDCWMYSPSDAPIRVGMFFNHPDDGELHRITRLVDKGMVGGYKRWVVERIQGSVIPTVNVQYSKGIF